jgi:hypothetical protein
LLCYSFLPVSHKRQLKREPRDMKNLCIINLQGNPHLGAPQKCEDLKN